MIKNYTEEQLEANYNKFIEALKKVFSGERLEKLLHMYSPEELGTELAIAPASGKLNFHSCYVGGYIDHVMNVARNAYKLKKVFEEGGGTVNFTDEELFFAAFHHDLGKLGDGAEPYYIPQESEWHQKNKKEYFVNNPIFVNEHSHNCISYYPVLTWCFECELCKQFSLQGFKAFLSNANHVCKFV